MKTGFVVPYLLLILSLTGQSKGKDSGLEVFLAPFKHLQVVIQVPKAYYSSTLLDPLRRMLIYLAQAERPLEILTDAVDGGGVAHVTRHAQNRVAWILMVAKYSKIRPIHLLQVVKSSFWYGHDHKPSALAL